MDTPGDPPPLTEEQVRQIIEMFPVGSGTTVKGNLTYEQAQQLDLAMRQFAYMLKQEHPHLSFNGLKQIVFAADYAGELAEQGKLKGHSLAPTINAAGRGVAMTNWFPDGCVVTVDLVLAHAFFGDDVKARQFAVHTLAHELCHVSDESFKAGIFGDDWTRPTKGLEYIYLPAASILWSEYFANVHAGSFMMDPTLMTGMLADVVKTTYRDLKTAVVTYRSDNNHSVLSESFRIKLKFLCQTIGYAAGALRGTGMTLEKCDPACAAVIADSQLAEDWPLVLQELDQLAESYGSWKDITALDPLIKRVQSIEMAYGFKHTVPAPGQVHMQIVFRDYLD